MWANFLGVSRVIFIFTVSVSMGCSSSNIFEEFSTQDDGPSLLRAAKNAINEGDYAAAIAACQSMTPADAAESEALYTCASAYAGSCGYTLLGVVNQVSTYTGPTPLIFEYFMEQRNGATLAQVQSCATLLTSLSSMGTAANRTQDENYLAIFSAFTHMGTILNLRADSDDDGTPDPAFDACNVAHLSDAETNQFGRALWELYRGAEVAGSAFQPIADMKTALDSLSTAISAVNVNYNFLLSSVDPTAFTANHRRGIRALIQEGDVFGLDYPCGNFAACICP